jgi:tetratricopeptide (TPR) repeat protein
MTKRNTDDAVANTVAADVGDAATTPGAKPQGTRRPVGSVRRGDSIGRFLVLDVIGQGGMGSVVSAHDPQLDRRVAIKVLHAFSKELGDTNARARMLREAQAMARLQHPNVAVVHEVGEDHGRVYIAMELVKTGTLREWLADDRSWAEVVGLYIQAGRGLAAAHRAGLVHRDFKPDNVLVTEDGTAKVTDFGLASGAAAIELDVTQPSHDATATTLLDVTLTRTGAVMGTPFYMAPEQHEDANVDASADQFAYCVALWEALYGARPFAGDSLAALAIAAQSGTVDEPPAARRRLVPAAIEKTLRTGLEVSPSKRHESMDVLIDRLNTAAAAPRRRNWTLAGAALVVVAGAAITFAITSRSGDAGAECGGYEDKLADAWTPAIKAEVRTAFDGTGLSYAAANLARVEARLDEYAGQWVTGRTEACRATFERGEQSDELLDRRMACYDRHLDRLRALAAQLRTADATVVDQAAAAAANLPPLASCEGDVQREQYPLPVDEIARAQIVAFQTRLDGARASIDLGSFQAALDELTQLVTQAEALAFPPAHAESLALLGEAQIALEQRTQARESLQLALEAAGTARDDILLVRVQSLLISILDDPGPLAQSTQALLKRLGDPPRERALFLASWARPLLEQKGFARVDELLVDANGLLEQLYTDGHPEIGRIQLLLATSAFKQGKLDESDHWGTSARAILREALGDEHPLTLQVVDLLGRSAIARGRHGDAIGYFVAAVDGLLASVGPTHGLTVSAQGWLAFSYFEDGQPERCLDTLERVVNASPRKKADFVSMEATCREVVGEYAAALTIALHALELAKEIPEAPGLRSRPLETAASVSLQLGEFDEAVRYSEQAVTAMVEEVGTTHHRAFLAQGLHTTILDAAGRQREALSYARELLDLVETMDPPEDRFVAYASMILAELLSSQGRHADAVEVARRGLELIERADPSRKDGMFPRLHTVVGMWELHMLDYETARTTCRSSLEMLERLDVRKNAATQFCLAEAELGLSRPEEAARIFEQVLESFTARNFHAKLMEARLRFGLARSLTLNGTDPDRAVALATQAQQTLASAGPVGRDELAIVNAWIQARPAVP